MMTGGQRPKYRGIRSDRTLYINYTRLMFMSKKLDSIVCEIIWYAGNRLYIYKMKGVAYQLIDH